MPLPLALFEFILRMGLVSAEGGLERLVDVDADVVRGCGCTIEIEVREGLSAGETRVDADEEDMTRP
jgi:hypothetical protein